MSLLQEEESSSSPQIAGEGCLEKQMRERRRPSSSAAEPQSWTADGKPEERTTARQVPDLDQAKTTNAGP